MHLGLLGGTTILRASSTVKARVRAAAGETPNARENRRTSVCPTSDERRPEPLRRNIPGTVLGRRRRSARPSCDAQIDELKGNPLTETRHLAKAIIEGGSGREMPRGGAQEDPTLGHVACLTRFVARGTKRSPARSAHRGVRVLINLRKRSSKSDERQPSPRRSQAARARLSPLLHHSQGLTAPPQATISAISQAFGAISQARICPCLLLTELDA